MLLLLEHPPVYTRGRRSRPEELPMGAEWYEMQGIEVRDTDRGGRVTYHGPGPAGRLPDRRPAALRRRRPRVRAAARAGDDRARWPSTASSAQTIEGLTGVWTDAAAGGRRPRRPGGIGRAAEARKIGSIGVHVSRGVTTHGLAVNVNNDLQPFEWVVPCGIEGCQVTSLGRELGAEQDLGAFAATLVARFAEVFGREPVAAGIEQIDGDRTSAAPAT